MLACSRGGVFRAASSDAQCGLLRHNQTTNSRQTSLCLQPDGKTFNCPPIGAKSFSSISGRRGAYPCREEIPHFVELQQKYGDRGLQVIGVSMDDSPEPVRPFYQQFHMNYPVVMGTAKTGELYGGVLGLPIAFLIDRDGRIYTKHIGATDAVRLRKRDQAHLDTPTSLAQAPNL